LLTPVFYVLVRRLTNRSAAETPKETTPSIASAEANHA
jgi:hypothetical protein